MRRAHSGILLAISAALALGACGLVEIKPAYDTSNASTNSGQASASAPITFHNNPQPAQVAEDQATSADDAPKNEAGDLTLATEAATIVETSALIPTAAPIKVAELSELPEVTDPTSVVQELAPAIAAPQLISSDANTTNPVTPASAEPLQRKLVAASITPNILVESQVPELAVDFEPQADAVAAEAEAVAPPAAAETVQNHTVVEGDTLFSIANKYGVSVEQLAQLNSVAAPNYLIYPDMIIKTRADPVAELSYAEHEVVEGETVYSISQLYQMQPEELARLNDIEIPQYLIYPKTTLRVRAVEQSSAADEAVSIAAPSSSEHTADWQWPLAETGQSQEQLTGELSGVLLLANAGDVVSAAKGGKVVIAGDQIRPIKLVVLLEHDGGYISFYGYLSDLLVGQGDEVVAGQPLGPIDSNGRLYFDVRLGSTSINIDELY